MADQFEDVDPGAMHRALATCLPEHEPPLGVRLDHVTRLGRRRQQARRAIPLVAAVVTAVAVAVPWAINTAGQTPEPGPGGGGTSAPGTAGLTGGPSPAWPGDPTPSIGTAIAPPAGNGQPSSPANSSAPNPAPPAQSQPWFRMPAGHQRDKDADTLATAIAGALPAGKVADHIGTRSTQPAGERYGYGFHQLWQDGGRYGYLLWLHRTTGTFPLTDYGLPAEPCADPASRLPAYNCAPIAVPEGGTAHSFDVAGDYRMRGIVWDGKDSNGGPDIRVTVVFYLPGSGSNRTPFSVLDNQPKLPAIPMTIPELAKLIHIPGY